MMGGENVASCWLYFRDILAMNGYFIIIIKSSAFSITITLHAITVTLHAITVTLHAITVTLHEITVTLHAITVTLHANVIMHFSYSCSFTTLCLSDLTIPGPLSLYSE
jgi:hypothetical protein